MKESGGYPKCIPELKDSRCYLYSSSAGKLQRHIMWFVNPNLTYTGKVWCLVLTASIRVLQHSSWSSQWQIPWWTFSFIFLKSEWNLQCSQRWWMFAKLTKIPKFNHLMLTCCRSHSGCYPKRSLATKSTHCTHLEKSCILSIVWMLSRLA